MFLRFDLTNEGLLLGCIVFTLFLLYETAKDFIVSSLSSDLGTIKSLLEKKLTLLSKIYAVEQSIIEQQLLLISSIEDCIAKLATLENDSEYLDLVVFENLLNTSFSESLFEYYNLELKDDFYNEYFLIEESFEESSFKFIEDNFLRYEL